jgi:ABC-type branched-subunit amino acid transport system ATPase component
MAGLTLDAGALIAIESDHQRIRALLDVTARRGDDIRELCDIITVLQRGRILAEGPYQEVSKNPEVREAYMGTGHA